jgi:hypothetical protein
MTAKEVKSSPSDVVREVEGVHGHVLRGEVLPSQAEQDKTDAERIHGELKVYFNDWEKKAELLFVMGGPRQLFRLIAGGKYKTFKAYCKGEFRFDVRRGDMLIRRLDIKQLIAQHDPEAAVELTRDSSVGAIDTLKLPLGEAIAAIRAVKASGQEVNADTLTQAATGTLSPAAPPTKKIKVTTDLVRILTKLEKMKDAKIDWDGMDLHNLDEIGNAVDFLKTRFKKEFTK